MNKWGHYPPLIMQILEDQGPSTREEICRALGEHRMIIGAIVGRMAKRTPQSGKRLYISGWTYDCEGQRRYPRAIYAIGDKPNATKPKSDVKENSRRYRESVRKKFTANSVFNLGMTRRQYEAIRREA